MKRKNSKSTLSIISYIIGVFILSSLTFTSCVVGCMKGNGDIQEREIILDPINGVELAINADVFITYGEEQKITVEGSTNLLDNLKKEERNGIWKIGNKRCVRGNEKVKVYITAPYINHLDISGSGDITIDNFENVTNLDYSISGSGNIYQGTVTGVNDADMKISGSGNIVIDNIEANEADIKISGSGNVSLAGEATSCNIDISGSGDINTMNMPCVVSDIEISGSGDCKINVSNKITAHISGSGNIEYIGTASVDTNITGSGDIINKN